MQTFIKIAFRNLIKHKIFTFINIFGFAIGLTCCLLIFMYLFMEFSYDQHHELKDRLYQVGTSSVIEGKAERFSSTPAPLAPTMKEDFPEVESYARLMKLFRDDKTLFQYTAGSEKNSFYETKGYAADSTFFRLFTYNFIEGDPATALNEPHTVVITQEIAEKIFGKEPALNKTIHINSNTNGASDYKITGVCVPSKTPSHIDARFYISMQSGEIGKWIKTVKDFVNNNMFYSYLLLKPGTDPITLESKFDDFIIKYAGEDLKESGRSRGQFLIPVTDIHLNSNTVSNVTPPGNLKYLYILLTIAIITLLIACINFMNLSTARSTKRALEVGVRKVLGADKKTLVRQFLWEAIILALVSFLLSLLFTFLLNPLFEELAGRAITFSLNQYLVLFTIFLGITLLAGLIAGIYPAFYLSSYKPIKVLKGRLQNSLSAVPVRKVLVVFQFVISVALIVASVTISRQMSYMRSKDLGFKKDQQIIIPLRSSTSKEKLSSLKNELQNQTAIVSVGASEVYPGIPNFRDWLLYKQGDASDQTHKMYMNIVDKNYLKTLGVEVVAGRLFSEEFPADTANGMVINEEAVKQFGLGTPEEAIGKSIVAMWGKEVLFPLVGVIKNFHFKGLQSEIESYAFILGKDAQFNYMIAHTNAGNVKPILSSVESMWNKIIPDEPFEYSFLNQDFEKNYLAENRLATIIQFFTIIAIFISCLGLFGLATFTAEQRTKEIGIRKVLGATIQGLVGLLSKDFIKLVLLSVLIASPIAWFFMNKWLENFAYRTPITLEVFLISSSIALLIAFITISFQTVRAAIANPVKNLRTE